MTLVSDRVEAIQTDGHPIVFGESKRSAKLTILLYGHYDVQPPDPIAEWFPLHLTTGAMIICLRVVLQT